LLDVITPEDRQVWAEANTMIGKAHTIAKRTNQARDYFNAALKFEPKFAEACEGMGLSYAEDQLDAQAVEGFLKAIELDPENPQYYLTLATYYHKTRKPVDPAKALPLYQKYQALGGRDPGVSERIKECGGK
jgi:tetratricopeptide (TPR) repeat protein